MHGFLGRLLFVLFFVIPAPDTGYAGDPSCEQTVTNPTTNDAVQTHNVVRWWSNQEVRDRTEKLFTNGVFQHQSGLAKTVLDELKHMIQIGVADADLYQRLRDLVMAAPSPAPRALPRATSPPVDRVKFRVDQIAALVNGRPRKFLDVGCGDGAITAALATHWQLNPQSAFGFEVHQRSNQKEFTLLTNSNDDFKIPAPGRSFDVATLMMVLHHSKNPSLLLQEIYRVMEPGGIVIVRDHDASNEGIQWFNRFFDEFYYKVLYFIPEMTITDHYRSVAAWRQTFTEVGFEVGSVTYPEPDNPLNPVHFVLVKKPTQKSK